VTRAGDGSRSGSGAPIEREIKLSVDRDFHLPDLTTVPGLSVVSRPEKSLVAKYYDTPGLDLARWGATLRYRGTGGTGEWTVKLEPPPSPRRPGRTGGADERTGKAGARAVAGGTGAEPVTVDRYEVEFQSRPGRVPKAARELTAGLRRGRDLAVVAELTTVRRAHLILDAEGTRLAELDDDTVEFVTACEPPRRGAFREIEVELATDGSADSRWTQAVYDLLTGSGARRTDGAPKLMRALGQIPRRPRPDSRLKASATVAQVVTASVGAGLHRFLTHEPALHLGAEPGPVHQCRVATGRICTQLEVISPLLDGSSAAAVGEALQHLVELLGAVRSADRLEARLRSYRGRLDGAERAELDGMADLVHRQRVSAAGRLAAAVVTEEHGRAVDSLCTFIADPPLVSPDRAGAEALLPLLAGQWSELARAVGHRPDLMCDAAAGAELHSIRGRARRCRYAAEVAAPVLGRAGGLAKAVKDVQNILGEVQNASETVEWLRDTGLSGPASRALVAGRLIAMETSRADEARRRWEQVWNRTSDNRRMKWLAPSS
jgi:CHAD domain-containing protein